MTPPDGRLGRLAMWFVAVNLATVGAAMLLARVDAGEAVRQIALLCGLGG
ncbi:MAG: hypothetical protein Q8M79_05905 [Dehalococcoidia bacterium]|nr:hypothetical protein [Dehalococcoidia bacterium]